jgi:transposase
VEEAAMRGTDSQQSSMFSYVSAERRVPRDHPLRAIRTMADTALSELSARLDRMYAVDGRPSIAPEKLLRGLLLQVLYTVRSERQLMEQLDYNLLFRWFVGLSMDDPVWDVTVFTKNRERLLAGKVAQAFFNAVLDQARTHDLLSADTSPSTVPWSRRGLRSRASSPRRRDRGIRPMTPAIRR